MSRRNAPFHCVSLVYSRAKCWTISRFTTHITRRRQQCRFPLLVQRPQFFAGFLWHRVGIDISQSLCRIKPAHKPIQSVRSSTTNADKLRIKSRAEHCYTTYTRKNESSDPRLTSLKYQTDVVQPILCRLCANDLCTRICGQRADEWRTADATKRIPEAEPIAMCRHRGSMYIWWR